MWFRNAILICLTLLMVGCAGPASEIPSVGTGEVAAEQQRQLSYQLQAYASQNARLQSVFHRVAAANAEFCGDRVAMRLGFLATTIQEVPARYRAIAPSALGLDDRGPTVIAVAEGGPASGAGMMVGDVLVAVDGEAVPADKGANAWLNAHLASRWQPRMRVEVLRQGKPVILTAAPVMACAHPISLAFDDNLNAFTDGRQIVVHSGLMRLVQSDAELATVIGHELAHITMEHIKKARGNQIAGAVGGFLIDVAFAAAGVNSQGAFTRGFGNIGRVAFATEFEREADYVGAYYVARAGFDGADAEKFWRTMAQENPRQIFFAGRHPTSPERFLQLQKTNEEIANKRRLNLPLRPEVKVAQTTPAPAIASND